MLGLLAAALLAPTPPSPPTTPETVEAPAPPERVQGAADPPTLLESAIPWWERITVTVDAKGEQQSCRYDKSISPSAAAACDKVVAAAIKARGQGGGPTGLYQKLVFERRFSPGARLDAGKLSPGDTLLGRQVMYLTFDGKGAITSCKVIAASGGGRPDYGCEQVRKEQFRALSDADPAALQAFMTVLAYGHTEAIA
ncbi:MAG: hypothetical protein ACJ8E8_12900 [Sphingomicrobium sp.]